MFYFFNRRLFSIIDVLPVVVQKHCAVSLERSSRAANL